MAESTNGRVTMRAVDEKLDAMRREFKLWVAVGLLGGQTLGGLVTALVTRTGPPEQAQAIAHFAAHLF